MVGIVEDGQAFGGVGQEEVEGLAWFHIGALAIDKGPGQGGHRRGGYATSGSEGGVEEVVGRLGFAHLVAFLLEIVHIL